MPVCAVAHLPLLKDLYSELGGDSSCSLKVFDIFGITTFPKSAFQHLSITEFAIPAPMLPYQQLLVHFAK